MKKNSKIKAKSKNANKSPKKGLLFHIGNLLILLSLIGAFVIFYPVVNAYLFPPKIVTAQEFDGDNIRIPKIKAQAPLIFNVNPWDESIYQEVLKTGVAHAEGTSLPGKAGRSFIFAHSSGNPFEITQYNTVFLKLGELEIGDKIEIKREDEIYKYKVTKTEVVSPNEIEYLLEEGADGIVVQTCWPIGTDYKRLLVFAAPVN